MTMIDERADTTQRAARFDVPFLRYMTSREGRAADYERLVQKLTFAHVGSTNTFDDIQAGLFSLKMYITLKYSATESFFGYENAFIPGTLGFDSPPLLETGSWIGNNRLHRSLERLRALMPTGRVGHQETLGELRVMGLDGAADRLQYLQEITEEDEDEPDLQIDSLQHLAQFLISERKLKQPRIGVSPIGLLQIEWLLKDGGILALWFLADGKIKFVAISGRPRTGVERERVSGIYRKDEMMLAVKPFLSELAVE